MTAAAGVDDEVRSALMQALARLVWEGRASRERVLALLDRFDREALAPVDSWAWFGWQEAIQLLGLTDWIERVQRGWEAGRLSCVVPRCRSAGLDRADTEGRGASGRPEALRRRTGLCRSTIRRQTSAGPPILPVARARRPTTTNSPGWTWRCCARVKAKNMCLEEADGLLTALAAGPVRVPASEYLAEILLAEGETAGFDSPEHRALVADLLTRHHDAIERDLAAGKAPEAVDLRPRRPSRCVVGTRLSGMGSGYAPRTGRR